jgi:hypothetical protein
MRVRVPPQFLAAPVYPYNMSRNRAASLTRRRSTFLLVQDASRREPALGSQPEPYLGLVTAGVHHFVRSVGSPIVLPQSKSRLDRDRVDDLDRAFGGDETKLRRIARLDAYRRTPSSHGPPVPR